MRVLGIIAILLMLACTPTKDYNTAEELAKIEETRAGFGKALAEKRYQDTGQFTAEGIISIGPGSSDYGEMYALGQERGTFPYDSIKMHPLQTVIVNDTLAYDFGWSEVFFTNNDGEVVRLDNSFLALLKKEKDGVWRLWREVASTNIPENMLK